jgi:hypothetical protein
MPKPFCLWIDGCGELCLKAIPDEHQQSNCLIRKSVLQSAIEV